MVDLSYRMPITSEEDLKEYKEIIDIIIGLAHHEAAVIRNGGESCWELALLDKCVIPEMAELQQYALCGELFLKYGKQQRMLESTYMMTDSINMLNQSPLGIQIGRLQRKIDSL